MFDKLFIKRRNIIAVISAGLVCNICLDCKMFCKNSSYDIYFIVKNDEGEEINYCFKHAEMAGITNFHWSVKDLKKLKRRKLKLNKKRLEKEIKIINKQLRKIF